MKNRFLPVLFIIAISLLIHPFLHNFGLARNEPDTIRVECLKFVRPQTTVTADLRIWTDQPLGGFVIPLTFYDLANTDIVCDSVAWSSTFWSNTPAFHDAIIDSSSKKIEVYGAYIFGNWPIGDNLLATLYLTTGSSWDPSVPMTIDSTSWYYNGALGIELVDDFGNLLPYEFIPGCLSVPSVPTHTPWTLIISMLVVAGVFGYMIMVSRKVGPVR